MWRWVSLIGSSSIRSESTASRRRPTTTSGSTSTSRGPLQELPSGKTIAHGYLTLSLIPALTSDFVTFENLERAINFGSNKTRYYAMVPVGARVRARATIKEARKRAGALHLTSIITVEVEGERKPACVTETIGMYFFK